MLPRSPPGGDGVDIPFTSTDIWLLLSIALAEDQPPVRLKDVLFVGDALHKAVFTPQELRRGLSKLTRASFVIDHEGTYSLTPQARVIVETARAKSADWLSQGKQLERQLGATRGPEDAPDYDDPRFPYPALPDQAVREATDQYRIEFASSLARLRQDRP